MESLSLRLLYRTPPGRLLLKVLTRPGLSRLAGRYLDSPHSRWLIPRAIRSWSVDLAEFESDDFPSFNAFFSRRRRAELLQIDMAPLHLISPCDGFLSVHSIGEDSTFSIKRSEYSAGDLLGDAALAERFRGGLCFLFRLTPRNYHRYCHIDDAVQELRRAIPGKLHCVRPIACERYPVYVQNSRECTLLRTEHFGTIAQVEIGALLVGRICNRDGGARVCRGEEKGCFEFGGSSIAILFEASRVQPDARILEDMDGDGETPVRMGERIGVSLPAN